MTKKKMKKVRTQQKADKKSTLGKKRGLVVERKRFLSRFRLWPSRSVIFSECFVRGWFFPDLLFGRNEMHKDN